MKCLFATATLFTLAAGCASIPVHVHTESTIRHADGTVEHKSSDWEGTLDQLPAQLGKAGKDLGAATAQMAKELTDVPPPGHVELKDLHPDLAKYQGQKGIDFLKEAQDDQGKPIDFQYVQLGVPQYDEFFKTAQEIYALLYETTQLVSQMRQVAAKLTSTQVDANAELKGQVDKALGAGGDGDLTARLQTLSQMSTTLAKLLPHLAHKIEKLVTTGEALVTNAAASITNPKVIAHLDLVKTGLVDSVKVIKESGGLVVDFSKALAGWKSA